MTGAAPRIRVLHLDDNPADAELVRHALLQELDADLVQVSDGPAFEAALASRGPFDLVLCDYSLPAYSGPQAARVLRAVSTETPFILVTGSIGDEGAAAALRAGITDFVIKNRLERLVPAVRRALDEASERRQRRDLEEQLRQSQKMQAVGQLTGGIAHDFNNLLTVMTASAELVLMGLLPEQEEMRKDLEAVLAAGARGREMIRKLLGFSRRQALELTAIDVARFTADIADTLRRLLPAVIAVKVDVAPKLPAAFADGGSLEQMILNLATNARDAMPNGGTFSIRADLADAADPALARHGAPGGHFIRIAATDTGIGMTPDVLERVFEPFFTTKAPDRGTGLGMAMIYGLAKQQRGFVDIASAPGAGTTVALYVPLADRAARVSGEQRPVQASPAGRGVTVLVADDEATLRRATERALNSLGFRVLTAASGREALKQLTEHHKTIALVITDQMMPDFSGAEVYRSAREAGLRTPFLVTSGYSSEELEEKGFGEEVKRLMKPWTIEELKAAVLGALSRA